MQAVPKLRNLLNSRSLGAFPATQLSSFHSTAVCDDKRKKKWNSAPNRGQHQETPSKNYIRFVTRQKRADAKRALKSLLFNGGPFESPSQVYIAPVTVGISWIWPFCTALNNFSLSFKLISTQATPDEVKAIDDTLNNQILSAVVSNLSDSVVCNLINQLCRAGNFPSMARLLLHSLHHKRVFPSINAYDLLLEASSQRNDIDLSLQIFKEMLISSRALSSKSFFHLARAFSKMDGHIQLLKFVSEVSDLTLPRSLIIMNRIIFALAECGNVDKALTIFDFMKSSECKPDLFTYNTILGILGRGGRVDDILIQFTSMKEADISPDLVTYNTLINNFGKSCRLDLCLMFWREMQETGIRPDLRTYSSLIDSLGRCGNVEESLRLFDEMKCRQIKPSIYVYRSLVDSLKMMGRLEDAAALQEEMVSSLSHLVGPKNFKSKKR